MIITIIKIQIFFLTRLLQIRRSPDSSHRILNKNIFTLPNCDPPRVFVHRILTQKLNNIKIQPRPAELWCPPAGGSTVSAAAPARLSRSQTKLSAPNELDAAAVSCRDLPLESTDSVFSPEGGEKQKSRSRRRWRRIGVAPRFEAPECSESRGRCRWIHFSSPRLWTHPWGREPYLSIPRSEPRPEKCWA